MPTPHIEAPEDGFAQTVIMPGDPLRAKYIAENYLEDVVQINNVRGMLAFTGKYKGKPVSVMGHGMGMPSIGIYSHELYEHYNVENIIRVGSCGAYSTDYDLYDVVIVEESYSESNFIELVTGEKTNKIKPSSCLNGELRKSAERQEIALKDVISHCSDVFYRKNFDDYKTINKEFGCGVVDMETAALFANAKALNKRSAAVMTVSDDLVRGTKATTQERQHSFTNMMEVALGT
eukprot:Awhi_evm1s7094